MLLRKVFLDTQWGGKSLVALYLSLISGVVIALQYDPSQPYYSASSLDLLVPFGVFWRSLHFYSSQLFFILSLFHALTVLIEKAHYSLSLNKWILLVVSQVVCLLLLFTGYVLRGDATGSSAGLIAENILLSIPVIGHAIDSLLFALIDEGMKRVYANHLVGLGLLWLVLSWDHVRRFRVTLGDYPLICVAIICFSAFVAAPIEPEQIGVFHINGPWFFLGIQELLRHFHPFWAGIIWPGLFVVSLVLLHRQEDGLQRGAIVFASAWLLIYVGASILGLSRGWGWIG